MPVLFLYQVPQSPVFGSVFVRPVWSDSQTLIPGVLYFPDCPGVIPGIAVLVQHWNFPPDLFFLMPVLFLSQVFQFPVFGPVFVRPVWSDSQTLIPGVLYFPDCPVVIPVTVVPVLHWIFPPDLFFLMPVLFLYQVLQFPVFGSVFVRPVGSDSQTLIPGVLYFPRYPVVIPVAVVPAQH